MDCIFCKIVDKKIPADIIYEDDLCMAFHDINKISPVHFLVIPKKHISCMNDIEEKDKEILGHIMTVVPKLAEKMNVDKSGYRTISNCGIDAKQSVMHIHFHIMGGRELAWPAG